MKVYNGNNQNPPGVANTMEDGVECMVELGAVDIPGGGVRIIMNVNGVKMLDYSDTTNYIPYSGCFSMLAGLNHQMKIRPAVD